MIDRYIHFYNHERIQYKTGVAPLTLRHASENSFFLPGAFFVLSALPWGGTQYGDSSLLSVSFPVIYIRLDRYNATGAI